METENIYNILQALQKDRLSKITKEALIRAFNDDGISDLEGVAEHMLKRIRKDIELQKTEPHLIDFAPLARRTPQEAARSIIHATPEVRFILDGVTYDPGDIRRFDGQALLFTPIVQTDGSAWLQVFHEDIGSVIANYFQMQQIGSLLNPNDFSLPGLPPPTPPGTPPGFPPDTPPYPPLNPPGGSQSKPSGSPLPHRDPPPPVSWGQIQMFDDADYSGNWFWLVKGYMWKDLTEVSRGGWFGGDWNDQISSLASTNTSCIYCEHINLEGSKLFLGPQKPIPHLSALGWNDRISSVWNYG